VKDTYFAHSANPAGNQHSLQEHLFSVSRLAGESLRHWKGADEARLAGLLHDLGKYGDRFQARLRGQDQGLDHWSQGAWLALREYQCVAAALAIQGHHIGLQAGDIDSLRKLNPATLKDQHPLRLSLSDADLERLKSRLYADGLKPEKPAAKVISPGMLPTGIAAMLDVRMLFSLGPKSYVYLRLPPASLITI
jgi:CRISPR-associated endonuclease Cas3-HD